MIETAVDRNVSRAVERLLRSYKRLGCRVEGGCYDKLDGAPPWLRINYNAILEHHFLVEDPLQKGTITCLYCSSSVWGTVLLSPERESKVYVSRLREDLTVILDTPWCITRAEDFPVLCIHALGEPDCWYVLVPYRRFWTPHNTRQAHYKLDKLIRAETPARFPRALALLQGPVAATFGGRVIGDKEALTATVNTMFPLAKITDLHIETSAGRIR